MSTRFFLVLLISSLLKINSFAQQSSKAMFILDVAPDARSAGIGDAAVSTFPDAVSQKKNASKYIFALKDFGVSLSYMPWLRDITKDLNLGYVAGYGKIKENQVLAASFTCFTHGNIELSTDRQILGTISSNEYAFDISYSRKLGEYISGGITFRYISSVKVTTLGNAGLRSTSGVATDISFFYNKPLDYPVNKSNLMIGASLTNLGTKIKYSDEQELFLPMNLNTGITWEVNINDKNSLALSFEFVKSLVPSVYKSQYSVIEAIGKSFGKDQGDLSWIFGVEYSFEKILMLRSGYHSSREVPSYRYFTFGAGLAYKFFNLDFSYLITNQRINSSLSNTFRISLGVRFNKQ